MKDESNMGTVANIIKNLSLAQLKISQPLLRPKRSFAGRSLLAHRPRDIDTLNDSIWLWIKTLGTFLGMINHLSYFMVIYFKFTRVMTAVLDQHSAAPSFKDRLASSRLESFTTRVLLRENGGKRRQRGFLAAGLLKILR